MTSRLRSRLLLASAAPLLAVVAAVVPASAAPASASTSALPYTDPDAVGFVALCDRAGHAVTGGSIHTRPFVWRAISSAPPPAGYGVTGRSATLFAFQPRQDVPAGNWSGAPLTASARYTSRTAPMAAATQADDSLADYMGDFAPKWDGLLELRMIDGAPNEPPDTLQYAATDIKVTGDTWSVVRGGTLPCDSGKAESLESLVGLAAATAHATPPSAASKRGRGTASPTAAPRPTASAATTGGATATAAATDASHPASSTRRRTGLVTVVLVAAALLAIALALRRRRRAVT